MRVLLVSERYFPTVGGGEYHIQSLASEYARMGHDVDLVCRDLRVPGKKAMPREERLLDGKFCVHRIGPAGEFESAPLRAGFPLNAVARAGHLARMADVVHAQSILAGPAARMLGILHGKPSVYTIHGLYQGRWDELAESGSSASFNERAERAITYLRYARTISVDMAAVRTSKLMGKDTSRMRYVPNGVDCVKYGSVARNPAPGSFLFVGRLVRQKGLPFLLKAVSIVRSKGKTPQVEIVGEGPLEKRLKGMARDLCLDDCVRFRGRLPDAELLSLYGRCQSFILPSVWEGLPLTLLEAWAAGMPVVATAVGGIPDIATHEKDSLICASQDPRGLADAMLRVMDDPALAEELGRNGRALVNREYTWERCANRTLDVYREAIEL